MGPADPRRRTPICAMTLVGLLGRLAVGEVLPAAHVDTVATVDDVVAVAADQSLAADVAAALDRRFGSYPDPTVP